MYVSENVFILELELLTLDLGPIILVSHFEQSGRLSVIFSFSCTLITANASCPSCSVMYNSLFHIHGQLTVADTLYHHLLHIPDLHRWLWIIS